MDKKSRTFFVVSFIAMAVFLSVGLATRSLSDWPFMPEGAVRNVQNMAGPLGSLLAWLAVFLLGGIFAWFVPIAFFSLGVALGAGKASRVFRELVKALGSVVLLNAFFSLAPYTKQFESLCGSIGRGIGSGVTAVFGNMGGTIVITAALLIMLFNEFGFLSKVTWKAARGAFSGGASLGSLGGGVARGLGHLFLRFSSISFRNMFHRSEEEQHPEPDVSSHVHPLVERKPIHEEPKHKKASPRREAPKVHRPKKEPSPDGRKAVEPEQGLSLEDASLPPLSILKVGDGRSTSFPQDKLRAWANILEEKLANYNITGKVTTINHGPLITTFEFEPAPGVKIRDIVSRADDIALAMEARSLRLIAPIPGRGAVGIEIPNPESGMVYLNDVLKEIPERLRLSGIMIALGVDVMGKPFYMNLCNAPHLLIAGTTGSGKSVCLHSVITSILLQYRPSDVRLLIVDPKMVEMTSYNDIPHLLHPVTNDPREAIKVFNYLIAEMGRRNELFKENSVKNIESYNSKLGLGRIDGEGPKQKLPYIVLIVDELGDLVISKGPDIESMLSKISNMARAVGIHMVVATQRPSVDVIVGRTKANFPTRIAFRVASKVDSRTILDSIGAEKLLGRGDMLYADVTRIEPVRLHGAFISEGEVEEITSHWKQYDFEPATLELVEDKTESITDENGADPLFEQAKDIVIRYKQGSTSLLQRKLHIGYARAARLLDQMEASGIVGPPDGSKPREVLVGGKVESSMND